MMTPIPFNATAQDDSYYIALALLFVAEIFIAWKLKINRQKLENIVFFIAICIALFAIFRDLSGFKGKILALLIITLWAIILKKVQDDEASFFDIAIYITLLVICTAYGIAEML